MNKVALITGITGQDGSYLCELLLEKKYKIYGIMRRISNINTNRIDHLDIQNNKNIILKYGDLSDTSCLVNILSEIKNTNSKMERLEVYNLGAMSHVKVSFEIPEYTADINGIGCLRLLEAIRICRLEDKTRFYQASTSELYGKVQNDIQNENTPFYPRSPYGVSKLFSYWITKNYREAYNMFCCNGILFNHESPRRGNTFVTKKITTGLNKILKNKNEKLVLGNIYSKRDWGHTKDFVKGMWLMLQADKPDDYVLSTGKQNSIKEFIEYAFSLKNFNIKWKGSGVNEIGYDSHTNRELIVISSKYFRPSEVDTLIGDNSKAKKVLNWEPKITFEELVEDMVNYDCR
jgi:GDPmannose 4,6-dehydratase